MEFYHFYISSNPGSFRIRSNQFANSSKISQVEPMKLQTWRKSLIQKLIGAWKKKRRRVPVPSGCCSVYVGPLIRRFPVKIERLNHPFFRSILEEAEMEYGFRSEGPILLPCEVDQFYRVLAEIEMEERFEKVRNSNLDFPPFSSSKV